MKTIRKIIAATAIPPPPFLSVYDEVKPAATTYEAVLNSITNSGTEVIPSPCRPAMDGLHSVNSAKVCLSLPQCWRAGGGIFVSTSFPCPPRPRRGFFTPSCTVPPFLKQVLHAHAQSLADFRQFSCAAPPPLLYWSQRCCSTAGINIERRL